MKPRLAILVFVVLLGLPALAQSPTAPPVPGRREALDAMKRATRFMVEKVSTRGGYVWSYLPDLSRRWGELEARDTMIWVQPPGTATMGHLFLDAYHATGDDYYDRAARKAADALIAGQLPSGGWNYFIDFAGAGSQRQWYATIGRNAWRLEEFQHDWGNATFDDGGTVESAELLLRLFLEKRDAKCRRALDRALAFVLESQYPVGAWPQRYPPRNEFSHHGRPDYTSFLTFNDEVTAGNVDFLLKCYQALGDPRLPGAIRRGMDSFLATQLPAPQAGWALQYTPSLEPAGARTYEPKALVTHATAANIGQLLKYYRLTGDARYIARVPAALDWLDSVRLPADVAAIAGGRSHPTFVEVGTNQPLYVHRRGSNAVNGEYYVDRNPRKTIGHYGSFRQIDVARLRQDYLDARALPPEKLAGASPLGRGARPAPLPRYFVVRERRPGAPGGDVSLEARVNRIVRSLDAHGRWLVELATTSHPYRGDAQQAATAGDFSQTLVGDESDTSPYPPPARQAGISTSAYVHNMTDLILFVK